MRRALLLTVLVTLFASACQIQLSLEGMAAEKSTPTFVIALQAREVLSVFLTGLIGCIWLFAVSSLLEGRLERRLTRWEYFCARVKRIC